MINAFTRSFDNEQWAHTHTHTLSYGGAHVRTYNNNITSWQLISVDERVTTVCVRIGLPTIFWIYSNYSFCASPTPEGRGEEALLPLSLQRFPFFSLLTFSSSLRISMHVYRNLQARRLCNYTITQYNTIERQYKTFTRLKSWQCTWVARAAVSSEKLYDNPLSGRYNGWSR